MTTRVYIVEDHPVMRQTLSDYLGLFDDLEVCGSAANAEEAISAMHAARPDVVLLDLSLPGRSGLDLLDALRGRSSACFVILSGHGERGYVERALSAGARGYVLKGRPSEVPVAIQQAAAGQVFISPSLDMPAHDSATGA